MNNLNAFSPPAGTNVTAKHFSYRKGIFIGAAVVAVNIFLYFTCGTYSALCTTPQWLLLSPFVISTYFLLVTGADGLGLAYGIIFLSIILSIFYPIFGAVIQWAYSKNRVITLMVTGIIYVVFLAVVFIPYLIKP